MIETPPNGSGAGGEIPSGIDPEEGFRLIDLAEILLKYAKRILMLTLGAGVLTAIISMILPAWYASITTLFGPEEVSETRRVLTTLRSLSIPGVRQNVSAQSPETFLAILESRTLRESIIERFGLVKTYRAKGMEDCLRRLRKRVFLKIENTGVISVVVEDRDRQRAADIANAMVEELDKINVKLRIYKARRAREHLENQIVEVRTRLAASEDSLAQFQSRNLAVSIDDQAKAAVEAIAGLEAHAIALRIKMGLLESYASEGYPELRAARVELAEVESQLRKMEAGGGEGPAFADLPMLGRRLGELIREAKVGETLLLLLTQDYEDARLDEAKETPVVQVLDFAKPAERRVRPKRTLMVLSAMAAMFVLSSAVAVAADRFRAQAPDSERRRWSAIVSEISRWRSRRARAS